MNHQALFDEKNNVALVGFRFQRNVFTQIFERTCGVCRIFSCVPTDIGGIFGRNTTSFGYRLGVVPADARDAQANLKLVTIDELTREETPARS